MGLFNEHSSTTKTDSSNIQGVPGPQGIGYKLDANGNFDIENKKLTNVKNGDMNKDVMTKSQIEGYVSNKTQYLDGVLPAKVTNNKAVIYSPSGGIHSNGLYLKDQYGQEVHFYNEDQDDNQIRLYIPNLKNNDSYGSRLKSTILVSSINQTIQGKKIFHDIEVPNPTIDGHASNKAYVDNKISKISDDSDIYIKRTGDIMSNKLLIPNVLYPIQGDLRQTLSYESMREIFLSRRENRPMRTNLDMSNHTIDNVKNAINRDQVINKGQIDDDLILKADKSDLLLYLKTNGSFPMKGNLNMNGNRITGLTQKPFYNGEVVNKRYVDSELNNYLKINGDNMMINDLRMNGYRILGLSETPINKYEVTNKEYVDNTINKVQINPSHTPENILKYIMDDIDQTSSEYGIEVNKIDNFEESFHSYNKRVIYLKLIKDENDYEGRIGYNIFKLIDKTKDRNYTAVIEWLTTDNNVWSKMVIFNNITSGSIISNQTKKFEDGNGLYYTRSIIQIKVMKISTAPIYLLSTIHIENVNPIYPNKFSEICNIIYGVNGLNTSIQANVYDKHQAFELEKTKMKMSVDLDMNNKKIKNISNISHLKIFGKISNDHFFISSNDFPINFDKVFIYRITLINSTKSKSSQDAIIFNTFRLNGVKYPFTFPNIHGTVVIFINRYFERIFYIKLENQNNLSFELLYNMFH